MIGAIMIKKYLLLFLLATVIYAGSNSDIHDLYSKAVKILDDYNGQPEIMDNAKNILMQMESIDPTSNETKLIKAKIILNDAYIRDDKYRPDYLEMVKKLAEEVVDSDPRNIKGLLLLSSAYRKDGTVEGLEKSEEILDKAYQIDKNNVKVLLSLMSVYLKKGKYNEVISLGNIIIKNATQYWQESDALLKMIDAYRKLKQYDKVNDAYLRIIELESTSPWAYVNYASFLLGKHPYRNYDKAVSYAKKSLTLADFGMGHYILSKAYYAKGYRLFWKSKNPADKESAGKWFKLGTEAYPYASNYYALGTYYYYMAAKNKRVELLEKSIEAYEKCLEIKPSHSLARRELHRVKDLWGRVK